MVLKIRLLNVATPATAFTLSVPLTPGGVELMVIAAVDPVTTLPPASCTWTTMDGLSGCPAMPLAGGCVENTKLVATGVITVESVVFAVTDPPPDTSTEFTCGDVALPATLTVTVIDGKVAFPFSASLLVQFGSVVHVQPVPAIDTSVNPEGTASVTVTVPLVGPAPFPFDTVTWYVAFCWPCVKLPV